MNRHRRDSLFLLCVIGSNASCATSRKSRDGREHIGARNNVGSHFSSLLISRTIFSICLILQNILKLWECCGEGFYWAGGRPQARSRDKDGRLASHNGTITPPSPPHQKINPICWVLLFIHHITV